MSTMCLLLQKWSVRFRSQVTAWSTSIVRPVSQAWKLVCSAATVLDARRNCATLLCQVCWLNDVWRSRGLPTSLPLTHWHCSYQSSIWIYSWEGSSIVWWWRSRIRHRFVVGHRNDIICVTCKLSHCWYLSCYSNWSPLYNLESTSEFLYLVSNNVSSKHVDDTTNFVLA